MLCINKRLYGCNSGCGYDNIWWIIILLLILGGGFNNCGCDNGCGNNGCGCGNNGCGCGCN